MKVSGFTFIRNGTQLGFPFLLSIRSILPICDEFIVNVGNSSDDTLEKIEAIGDPKIRIIKSEWNDRMRAKGFVYGQQKMIAQYSCRGDWAFYLEGDELVHEKELPLIRKAMERHLENPDVEALLFDYLHFYGNINTYAWSPKWYRRAPRIIKTSVRSLAPDGLFWTVLDRGNKKGRYPKAALTGATMYHYGWVRNEEAMRKKLTQVEHFWNKKDQAKELSYRNIDPITLHPFKGSHPAGVADFFPKEEGLFEADPDYRPTRKERLYRLRLLLETLTGCDTSKKHFTLI